jgi:uncharacterized protein (TIGR02246 family)
MKSSKILLFVASALLAGKQVTAQSQPSVEEEATKAIAASNARYFDSFIKNDPSIFINSYTPDACVLVPNTTKICGREALAKFFKDGYEMGMRNGKFITTGVYIDGPGYATEEGAGKMYDATGKEVDDFKYLVLWKKTESGWKMYLDAFNSNLPQKGKVQ